VTPADLVSLIPLLLVGLGAVAVLLRTAVGRSAEAGTGIAATALGCALASLLAVSRRPPGPVTPLLTVDPESLWYWAVLLSCGLAVVLLVHADLSAKDEHTEEAQVLVLLATLGGCLLAASTHVAMVLLGLELLSVALYALVAYLREEELGIEAATKYLVLGAASTAFLLFGAALVYGGTGALGLAALAATPAAGSSPALVGVGVAMAVVGLGFKLAVVPFHQWAPDVYQGAPAPVTALVATVSKGAVVAMLARWVLSTGLEREPAFVFGLGAMAGLSMIAGNLLALLQDNVKRLLAYSSIAQMGYLLVALIAGGEHASAAVAFTLAAYAFTSIAALGVVSALSGPDRQAEDLADYRGLYWRHPWLAGIFTVALLSLAGVPLTAGFLGKLLVIRAGVEGAEWLLLLLLVVGSVTGFFYYLRVVATMFEVPDGEPLPVPTRSASAWVPVLLATGIVIGLGTVPGPLLGLLARW
jgi:NADH-quinone oxidoreductase subunit N